MQLSAAWPSSGEDEPLVKKGRLMREADPV